MPQVLNQLDPVEIIKELRRRGFGIDTCRGFAFRLSVRSKTDIRKSTGQGVFEPVGGITTRQWLEIRTTSRDVNHAADRVESLSLGRTQSLTETEDRPSSGSGPSVDVILKAVDNRIDAKLTPILQMLTKIQGMLSPQDVGQSVGGLSSAEIASGAELPASAFEEEDIAAELASVPPPPPPKKRGWPKGKPRKKKDDASGDQSVSDASE